MTTPLLSPAVLEELQQYLPEEDIQRGLQRLSEVVVLEGAALMSSEAKAQWSAIGARADRGRGTLVQRRDGVTLLILPFTKAVQMASTARSGTHDGRHPARLSGRQRARSAAHQRAGRSRLVARVAGPCPSEGAALTPKEHGAVSAQRQYAHAVVP